MKCGGWRYESSERNPHRMIYGCGKTAPGITQGCELLCMQLPFIEFWMSQYSHCRYGLLTREFLQSLSYLPGNDMGMPNLRSQIVSRLSVPHVNWATSKTAKIGNHSPNCILDKSFTLQQQQ